MVENTLFSQIDKILKIYPRLDEYISFLLFSGSRTCFKHLCGHILVSSKGNQICYINLDVILEVFVCMMISNNKHWYGNSVCSSMFVYVCVNEVLIELYVDMISTWRQLDS